MKFSELREATLTKTQIKKVHDKADDLPKNDFIKRYGKEGDSVRFATATKMVKKELGIEDYEEGFKSDAQRRAAFASGYKEKGKKKDEAIKGNDFVGVSTSAREYIQGKQAAKDGKKYDDNPYKSGNREMNIRRLNWSAGHNKAREELDDKDKETIKPIIKQLQKSVKAHDKQAKQLQKDIQDEVEITEASADFLRLEFEDADEVREFKKDMNRGLYRVGNRNQSARYGLYDKVTFNDNRIDGFSVELEGMEDADKFMKLMKRDGHEFTIDMREEVELTEAVSDAYVKQIARMTDRNDHFGVRIEIARLMKDKQLMSFYDSLEKMHMTSQIQNAIGNDAVSLRGKLEKVLKVRMKQRFGDKDSKRIMDAL